MAIGHGKILPTLKLTPLLSNQEYMVVMPLYHMLIDVLLFKLIIFFSADTKDSARVSVVNEW